jgi:probable F420-dependent oxidoreductase
LDFGLTIFSTDKSINPIQLAKEAEARGFESLWFPDHSHIPTSRETPWGGMKDAPPLPEEYKRGHDPFVALGACAAVTSTLKLGTGVTLVAQRDPIWLAKEVATLDALSDGRFLFGIGYGWNKEELRNHGVDYTQRRDILRENILLMKELWTKEEAEFSGDHIQFEKSWAWPKPAQTPHPPVIMGGALGPKTAAHVAEFCEGWMPIWGMHEIEASLKELQKACDAVGRDISTIEIAVNFGIAFDPEAVEPLEELGFKRAVLPLPSEAADEVLPVLDEYAKNVLVRF